MPSEISSPLADVVKRAMRRPPYGTLSELKRRFEGCDADICVLADVSGSMSDFIGSANLRKCDHLRIALEDVLKLYPQVHLVAFGSAVRVVKSAGELPEPCGGTPMDAAFERVRERWKPRKTIVISDGLPDDPQAALAAAARITGAVDTIYCGPDAHPAVEFLRRLSRSTGGVHVTWDGYRESLTTTVRGLLPAPE